MCLPWVLPMFLLTQAPTLRYKSKLRTKLKFEAALRAAGRRPYDNTVTITSGREGTIFIAPSTQCQRALPAKLQFTALFCISGGSRRALKNYCSQKRAFRKKENMRPLRMRLSVCCIVDKLAIFRYDVN